MFKELSAVYAFWCSRSYDLWPFKNKYETQVVSEEMLIQEAPQSTEQGEGLVAVHSSCERGAAPQAGVLEPEQVALGAYANLMLRKLPGSRLEAFQSALVKPAPVLLLCPLTLRSRALFCAFF